MSFKKLLLLILVLWPMFSLANNVYETDNYVVHYNAFTADTLPPQMASAYGILRSKYKGVLNISVQKKQGAGTLPKAVLATVTAEAFNLAGQLKELESRKVTEGDAVYYISEFRISNEERLNFKIRVLPAGESEMLEFKFTHQFYID